MKINVKNRLNNLTSIALVALLLCSCGTSYNVSTFLVNKDTNFDNYRSFAFVKLEETRFPKGVSIQLISLIKQDITNQMLLKGYVVDTTKNPSLAINLGMTVEDKQSVSAYTAPYGGGYYYGPSYYWGPVGYSYGWGAPSTTVYVDNYQVGTLLVDIIDFKNNILLWHGSVSSILKTPNDNQSAQKNLDNAIGDLLKTFPSIW